MNDQEPRAVDGPLDQPVRPPEHDVLAQLRLRILHEHGGTADPSMHHWNLTHGDSIMHREAAAEIERLRGDLASAEVSAFAGQVGQCHLGGLVEELRTELRRLAEHADDIRRRHWHHWPTGENEALAHSVRRARDAAGEGGGAERWS